MVKSIILLVESQFLPIPTDMEVAQEICHETVIGKDRVTTDGLVYYITGDVSVFRKWLGDHRVWTTRNPMIGWNRTTIDELWGLHEERREEESEVGEDSRAES